MFAQDIERHIAWNPQDDADFFVVEYGDKYDSLTNSLTVTSNEAFIIVKDGQDLFLTVKAAAITGLTNPPVYSLPSQTIAILHYEIPNGYSIISSQLYRETNSYKLSQIFTNLPSGSFFYKYSHLGGYSINVFEFNEWLDNGQDFYPGEGAWIYNPKGTSHKFHAWGVVPHTHTNTLVASNFQLIGTAVPKAGLLSTELKYPNGARYVYLFSSGGWKIHEYDLGEWYGGEPYIKRSEGFFIYNEKPINWVW